MKILNISERNHKIPRNFQGLAKILKRFLFWARSNSNTLLNFVPLVSYQVPSVSLINGCRIVIEFINNTIPCSSFPSSSILMSLLVVVDRLKTPWNIVWNKSLYVIIITPLVITEKPSTQLVEYNQLYRLSVSVRRDEALQSIRPMVALHYPKKQYIKFHVPFSTVKN